MRARSAAPAEIPSAPLRLLVGEVRTGFLQHSVALDDQDTAHLLKLDPRGRVLTSTRPRRWARSAELAEGVHCPLTTSSSTRAEGVGTVLARATVIGGQVVQAAGYTLLSRAEVDYRLPWSHYTARPGTLEVTGKAREADLAAGFLGPRSPGALDVGAVASRILDRVQRSVSLDRRPPLRALRTQFRFAVSSTATGSLTSQNAVSDGSAPDGGRVEFVVVDDIGRTLRISTVTTDLVGFVNLCEDLALHDWLLTTVMNRVEDSRIGTATGGELVSQLRPVIDHLLHLWMPGTQTGTDQALADVWEGLERQPGLSRQWNRLVDRIRDQMTLSVISLMSADTERGAEFSR